ncbi:MAG TPA: fibronectin type III domain-containing protein, partial [Anaerolineae bacterium]|nr:fibronectin type III domain-containing protein [Anaerolineae bacterium]
MNEQIRRISRNSFLVLALLGALLSLLVTTGSSLTPALAEPLLPEAPTVRIYAPEKDLLITERAGSPYTISGFAWDSTNNPGFPDDPVLNPISNPTHEPNYTVKWTAAAGALRYKLTESTSPYFDENVISYPYTTEVSYPIEDKADGVYYYRLKAYSDSGPSRWSNVVSTQVGAAALAATPVSQAVLPTVEVSINDSAWQPATVTVVDPGGYWSWTYIWALPEADNGVYTISARATISGAIGTVDTITVTIKNNVNLVYLPLVMRRFPAVPYPPVLNEISNADLDGNYTVSWAYNGPYDVQAPTSYTLQESTSADFSTGVQETTFSASTTSMNVTGKASATYYYRVRGNNTAGAGEWSNVRSVVVMSAITDDFSNSGSGWPVATYKRSDGGDLMRVEYVDGTYRMKIMLATSDQNNYKMGLVKAP